MNFDEIIHGKTPVLIDFFAEWCGPCRTMKPILSELKQSVGDRAVVLKIDIDKNPALAKRYQIQSVPTLAVFKEGKILWRRSGVMSAAALTHILQPHMKK
jgi:thioredoxin 1